jgi:hypothetical protein
MKRWRIWISFVLIAALLAGCGNAGNYAKDHYSLVNVDGKGKSAAKVYLAEGKTVPEAARELASEEKPNEMSKENEDQMFLVYDNRIINVHKDPEHEGSALVEIDSIEYARSHYDSSFLQGYLTGALLQSLFGSDWWDHSPSRGKSYKGYGSTGGMSSGTPGSAVPPSSGTDVKKPSTSDRSGSFSSKGSTSSGADSGTVPPSSSGSGSYSGRSGSFTTGSAGSSSSVRKNDGSTPSYKSPSKPSTSNRSGSFSIKRR